MPARVEASRQIAVFFFDVLLSELPLVDATYIWGKVLPASNSLIKKIPHRGLVLLLIPDAADKQEEPSDLSKGNTGPHSSQMVLPMSLKAQAHSRAAIRDSFLAHLLAPGRGDGRDNAYCLPSGSLASITDYHHCTKTASVMSPRKKGLNVCYSSPHYRDKRVPKCIMVTPKTFISHSCNKLN